MADDVVRMRLLQNLAELTPAAREALETLSEWDNLSDRLYEIWRQLDLYQADDPPHKAAYIVAKCHTMLEEFGHLTNTIRQHQEMEQKLAEHDRRRTFENG